MSTKNPNAASGSDNPSSSTAGQSSSSRGEFGNEPISVDTAAIRRAAAYSGALAEEFELMTARFDRLSVRRPLVVDGETDESWRNVEPAYVDGSKSLSDGTRGLAQAMRTKFEVGLQEFAKFAEDMEHRNDAVAGGAFRPPADPPARSATPPVAGTPVLPGMVDNPTGVRRRPGD
ncbi:hypothetical protein [Lentzea sp.]|uniref:hypothetical protein n=1 Tax=Lentzea sp. TaxID=56099 RepID=UPI002ED437EB